MHKRLSPGASAFISIDVLPSRDFGYGVRSDAPAWRLAERPLRDSRSS